MRIQWMSLAVLVLGCTAHPADIEGAQAALGESCTFNSDCAFGEECGTGAVCVASECHGGNGGGIDPVECPDGYECVYGDAVDLNHGNGMCAPVTEHTNPNGGRPFGDFRLDRDFLRLKDGGGETCEDIEDPNPSYAYYLCIAESYDGDLFYGVSAHSVLPAADMALDYCERGSVFPEHCTVIDCDPCDFGG